MNGAKGAAQRGLVIGVGLALAGVAALAGSANSAVDRNTTALPMSSGTGLTHLQEAPESPAPTPSAAVPVAAPATPDAVVVSAAAQISGASINSSDVLALVKKYFPADQVSNAMAVSRCESGHRNAVGATNSNGTIDWGVFQLNDGGTLQGALKRSGVSFSSTQEAQQLALNAEINVRAARTIFDSRGWQPWVCAYKVGVVAALYSSAHGPMYGQYDELGLSNGKQLSRATPATASAGAVTTPVRPPATPTPSPSTPASPPPSPSAPPTPTQPPTPEPVPAPVPPPAPVPAPAPPVTPPPAAPTQPVKPVEPAPKDPAPEPPAPAQAPAKTGD